MFHGLMKSLIDTTDNPKNIEILCAIDDDDVAVIDQVTNLKMLYSDFSLDFILCKRSEHFIRDYWNVLARKASRRWILAMNDDARFMTKGWDYILLQRMNEKADASGDDLWCGLIKDGINRQGEDPILPHFSCWALQSKQSVEVMGYFYNEKCMVWGPDHFVPMLYRRYDRLVSLQDIFIDHLPLHDHENPIFKLNHERMALIDRNNPHGVKDWEVLTESKKIRAFIEKRKIESR